MAATACKQPLAANRHTEVHPGGFIHPGKPRIAVQDKSVVDIRMSTHEIVGGTAGARAFTPFGRAPLLSLCSYAEVPGRAVRHTLQ